MLRSRFLHWSTADGAGGGSGLDNEDTPHAPVDHHCHHPPATIDRFGLRHPTVATKEKCLVQSTPGLLLGGAAKARGTASDFGMGTEPDPGIGGIVGGRAPGALAFDGGGNAICAVDGGGNGTGAGAVGIIAEFGIHWPVCCPGNAGCPFCNGIMPGIGDRPADEALGDLASAAKQIVTYKPKPTNVQ